ncbi:MAG: sigma factor [Isosphaeraceae bacterium]
MERLPDNDDALHLCSRVFATTHWGVVLAARDRTGPGARAALEQLCSSYWYPVYAFVRSKGNSPDEAQDLVQGFFARLLEKDDLLVVDPAKGRFRSFLMASCSHFLANQRDRERRLKRGGGRQPVTIDTFEAESRYRREPADERTPERIYMRRWASTLIERVLDRLGNEMAALGKSSLFETLKPLLIGDDAVSYRRQGAMIGLGEGAARVAVHRMRTRYREILREEVGRTVDDPADVDQEIRGLFDALSG